ncbi:c-type cytochrome [Piscinibacter sp. Jin2]|uniref:C-type cytochrome n=1 Tax=Aquariibacter lacus TaxID=2801332 RepID=A0A9X0XBH2_9BURK|nr:cytochrome c [Piscinibacter lacus]MBL0718311.1 c-type cytochrome [Piscinibacter lacus]
MILRTLSAALALVAAAPAVLAQEVKTPLYTVVDGNKVDAKTLNGFRSWRQANCAACHGANQEGLAGPSLVERMKVLSKDDFVKVVIDGRIERGMPPHKDAPVVTKNIDDIYAYLKGRSDGAIKTARVTGIE